MRCAFASKCLSVYYLNKQTNKPHKPGFFFERTNWAKALTESRLWSPHVGGRKRGGAQRCPLTCTRVSREKFPPLPSYTHTHNNSSVIRSKPGLRMWLGWESARLECPRPWFNPQHGTGELEASSWPLNLRRRGRGWRASSVVETRPWLPFLTSHKYPQTTVQLVKSRRLTPS